MENSGIRYMYGFFLNKIGASASQKLALHNALWLMGDKVFRIGIGLFVGLWVARYLGPESFGLLSYVTAYISLFITLSNLGLNGLVVRDLVYSPQVAKETLASAFVLHFIGGVGAFGLSNILFLIIRPHDVVAQTAVCLIGGTMIFKCSDVVRYWFESQVLSKYVVWLENGLFIGFAAVKVYLVYSKAGLLAFAFVTFFESIFLSFGLLFLYRATSNSFKGWMFNLERAKRLLANSWPLILSGLTVMIYMRTDQLIIGHLLGDEEVGIYSAAIRVSEVWYFIPAAIVASVFPAILNAKKQDEGEYRRRLQILYSALAAIAIFVAVPMTFLSDSIVLLMFGQAYAEGGQVLAVHIWTAIFVSLGLASGSAYLAENLLVLAFGRTLVGALINIAANFVLIPRMGILGAALGTLLAQFSAAYLFDVLHPKTRIHFWMKTKSIFCFYRLAF
jgi:O-antigen/teichoic acid export membrane protein